MRHLLRAPFAAWILGLVAVCELGLRAVGFERVPLSVDSSVAWNLEQDPLSPIGDGLHAASPRQLWSPMPGAPIAGAVGERVNAAGYRGPELARWKTPGVLRIAVLGDGASFAPGLAWSESYAAQLVARLRQPAEVLDAAVIGFSIEQGLERYAQLVRAHHPDVVVIAFCGVEESRPAAAFDDRGKLALLARRDAAWPWHSRLPSLDLRSVQALLWLAQGANDHAAALARLNEFQARQRARLAVPLEGSGDASWPGQRRVPPMLYEDALQRLVALAREDGALALLLAMPRDASAEAAAPVLETYERGLRNAADRLAVALCDARGEFRRTLDAGVESRELFLEGSGLSPRGHALLAELLARTLDAALAR